MKKVRDIIAMMKKMGGILLQRGAVTGVTVAGKPSDDMAPGTLNSILRQAGLKETR